MTPAPHPSRARAAARRGERGFALLEVIVAVGVFAMVLAMLQGALWTSQAFLHVVRPASGPIEDALVARRVLQQWFASFTPALDPADAGLLTLVGAQTGMRFPIAVTGDGGRPGIVLADLVLESPEARPGHSRLVARRLPIDAAGAPAPTGSVLMDWPGALAFAYSRAAPGEPAEWASAWGDKSAPPRRVAVMSAAGPVFVFPIERNLLEACPSADPRDGDRARGRGDGRSCGRDGDR